MKKLFLEGCAPLGTAFLLDGVGSPAGDFVSAGANLIGSFVNAHTSSKNTKRMIAAQREENEKAYQRNLEMWNKENAYNAPAEVVKRLRAAGLNPALAYGTPNVSAPAPDAPITDMSAMASMPSPVGAALESMPSARYLNALVENINAQTNKVNKESENVAADTERQLTYNQYQADILKGEINFKNASISLMGAESDHYDAQTLESYRNCDRILADTSEVYERINLLRSEIVNTDADTAIKRIQAEWLPKEKQASISEMYASVKALGASADLTREKFEQLLAQKTYNLAIRKTESENMFVEGLNLRLENDRLGVQLDMDKLEESMMQYDREHYAGQRAFDNVTKAVSTFTGGYRDVMFGSKYGADSDVMEYEENWNPQQGRYVRSGNVKHRVTRNKH